ncbi:MULTISPECIES: hypothetical protein [unclassified Meiothermus]|uniref:hypothetical protein n=1 Tax=unclassified Meiothermus TaxID=370471 RepID=UPI000D7CCF1C|nr:MULTISPECIES: hypothetical protein [unclassified Meiothermus]PZA07905.1 hypothetical protein DNA98_06300 [Meiothermus sp. Pnk-1]RYM38783.1 hypothetical protein EWH23_03380 [Meiothermus sp. PNK-Is4]
MVRYALIVLGVVLGLSVFFATRPVPKPPIPPQGVHLENVSLTLYPEQDPQAKWRFRAKEVVQDPGSRESKVTGLEEAARYVGNRLDLRLSAPEVTIDRNDNLRAPYATVEILKGCLKVELGEPGGPPVSIDQRSGFAAPRVRISSPTYSASGVNFTSDFAIEQIRWGDPAWKFYDYPPGQTPPCTIKDGG